MPLLSGSVRVNSTTGAVLDLTDANNLSRSTRSQVKGMGVFSDVASRGNVATNLRTQGYMAIVKNSATSVTPFFYKNTDVSGWGDTNNWMSLSSLTGSLPEGGTTNEVLAKTNNDDYQADWVSTIIVEDAQLKKAADSPTVPTLTFSRQKTSATLSEGDSLGELSSVGFNSSGTEKTGSSIKFVADGSVGSGIGSRVEFWTSTSGTSNTPEKALTVDTDKKIIFAGSSSAPTAVLGGMYYNTTNNAYYLGV